MSESSFLDSNAPKCGSRFKELIPLLGVGGARNLYSETRVVKTSANASTNMTTDLISPYMAGEVEAVMTFHTNRHHQESHNMSTPLEDAVLASYLADLREKGLNEALVVGVSEAFVSEKLPSAELMAELIRLHSGDALA